MAKEKFGGDQKVGESLLRGWEIGFVARNVERVPRWLETHHLTLLTVFWSGLILVFSWQARSSLHWLWLVSLMIFLQYLTDLFDGAVGRHRGTGLIKWGFFMDHLLDYLFQSCLVIGYWMISPPGLDLYFLGILALTGGFMVLSFLSFAATNRFEIYFCGLGPTEARLLVILMNAVIVTVGTSWWRVTVPIFCFSFLAGLVFLGFKKHRELWALDMEAKSKRRTPSDS